MAIDRDIALAHQFEDLDSSYSADDVILYHLGIGAGDDPMDPKELEWVYEKNLKVLPSFASVVPSGLGAAVTQIPGLDYDRRNVLHGEQDVQVFRPLPKKAKLTMRRRLVDIVDKGKAAVLIIEAEALGEDNEPYFTVRNSLFLRGEGGFGGPRGENHAAPVRPDREADQVIDSPTLPKQALLYRLCGDKNPLHSDPEMAKAAGFDRPILHGLCSYGIVCKAATDSVLEGNPDRVASYSARFTGVVFPGETIRTKIWVEPTQLFVEAETLERGQSVIRGHLILKDG